jgi:NADPH-dependent 2,4-dienoyl-CoA reductase/sulfur reductase-like enzyme/nitrite reductase/ring-hydroxylating ferredoxin subunit
MMGEIGKRDFASGVALRDVPDGGMVAGNVGKDEIILVRRGGEVFAIGAYCTHYHGPLVEGLLVDDTIRCPLHHACFSIRSGRMLRAPALDPIACWRVERVGDTVYVREKLDTAELAEAAVRAPAAPVTAAPAAATARPTSALPPSALPPSVIIVGGGAAGLAAADTLRTEGYAGPVTIISADDSPPCDRPNLSKDFLAGTASDDWIPLRSPEYYVDRKIDLILNSRVSSLDTAARRVILDGGRQLEFGALVLATGADPVHLEIPGASDSQLCYLRSFADSRAIVAKLSGATRVIVVGTSFIGLEVAASLRTRGIEVHVVGQESVPMLRVLGPDAGHFVQSLHEAHGVVFHLGGTVVRMEGRQVVLTDGTILDADFVVLGVGVRPSISLASGAGLTIDRGVCVNEYLETSGPGVFAAGDIARWPDPHSGERIRVEHWVVAERQGQVAARNILGRREKFAAVPFFWSQHYDVAINYVGHAEKWDAVEIDGALADRNCAISYKRGGKILAVATVSRDLRSLQAELAMEA